MSIWPSKKLGSLTTKIGSGATPRGGGATYVDSGISFIRSQNVLDHEMKLADIAHITDEAAHKLRGVTVEANDVLINITGDSIARCCVVDMAALPARVNQHVAILRTTSELDARFLQKFLVAPTSKELLIGISSGGTRKALTRSDLSNLDIPTPPLEVQHAIAEVLGALDDKITANTKIVETLAATFTAHWSSFASFSTAETATLGSLLGDMIGGDWGTSEATEASPNEVYCIRGADIADLQKSGLGKMPRRFLKTASLKRRQLEGGDLVIEISGGSPTQSTGRAVLITDALLERLDVPLISSNFCRIIRAKNPEDSFYLYGVLQNSWLRGEFFSFENGSTGIKNLAFSDYSSTKIVSLPSAEKLKNFNKLARSLFDSMQSFGTESSRLTATRDALLPQLMSGKLQVKDAEKVVEETL